MQAMFFTQAFALRAETPHIQYNEFFLIEHSEGECFVGLYIGPASVSITIMGEYASHMFDECVKHRAKTNVYERTNDKAVDVLLSIAVNNAKLNARANGLSLQWHDGLEPTTEAEFDAILRELHITA